MQLDQQPHKHGHKQRARKHMAADDIQAEIRKQDKPEPLDEMQLVGDLRVHGAVPVVRGVHAAEEREHVQAEMEEEEERVVDEEGGCEFEGETAACWGYLGECAVGLQWGGEGHVV